MNERLKKERTRRDTSVELNDDDTDRIKGRVSFFYLTSIKDSVGYIGLHIYTLLCTSIYYILCKLMGSYKVKFVKVSSIVLEKRANNK